VSALDGDLQELVVGDHVRFDQRVSDRNGKAEAQNVRVF
jgi:cold shock CspA family protein